MTVRKTWDDFFFRPIDTRPIGIFRILFGLLIFINGLLLLPDLLTWFGEKGALSMATAQALTGAPRINLLALLPSGDAWVIAFYLLHMLAALCLMLGLFTRVSAAAVFLTLVSFHHRNGVILNSGDTYIRLVSFLLIFSQAGASWSLDRAWKITKGESTGAPPLASPWAQRMIQLQLSIVYLMTVLSKLRGPTWRDGTAVYYASRLEDFQRFPVPWAFESMTLMRWMTWSTLAIEFSMATLVWSPRLRPYVLLAALSLHLGLEYSLNIPLFQWYMISTLILFVEPERIQAWIRSLGQLKRRRSVPVQAGGPAGDTD